MSATKPKFKWTVEIEVDETWVADGFDLTDERAHALVCNDLPYASGHEIKCKVIARPNMIDVNIAQGDNPDLQREGWPRFNAKEIRAELVKRGLTSETCKACDHRQSKGLEGQCPSCANERSSAVSTTNANAGGDRPSK